MKQLSNPIPFKDEREKFDFFLLSGLYGIVYFFVFATLPIPADSHPKPAFTLYILGWSLCPALGIVTSTFLRRIKLKFFTKDALFDSIFILLHFFFTLLVLEPSWTYKALLRNPWFLLGSLLLLQGLGFSLVRTMRRSEKSDLPPGSDPYSFYRLMLVLAALWILTMDDNVEMFLTWSPGHYLFLLSVCVLFFSGSRILFPVQNHQTHWAFRSWRLSKSLVFYGSGLPLLAYLVIDPHFIYQKYHSSFYLGPLSDLMAGKSLLSEINAQYGVFVFYFLKFFFHFIPLGYKSFTLLDTLLRFLQYGLFYFILRQLFRSELYSILCLASLLLVNYFSQFPKPVIGPSTGPLRFGFIYGLMALILLRNQNPKWIKICWTLESILVSAAFFWSLEVCLYTVPAYLGLILFESADFHPNFRLDASQIKKRMSLLTFFLFGIGAYLYGDIFSKTGGWPHWAYYGDYLNSYQNGLGSLDRPRMGFWCLLPGMLYVSLLTILAVTFQRKKENPLPNHFNAIVLLTFYGIFQFLYFIYRSHNNNLFHIAMPSLLLFAYWLNHLRLSNPSFLPRVLKRGLYGFAVFFIGVYLPLTFPRFLLKFSPEQRMSWGQWKESLRLASQDLPRDDQEARDAESLMEKYSGDQKRVVYFFGDNGRDVENYADYGLETSLVAHRVKLYPYNDLSQVEAFPTVLRRVQDFNPALKPGDFIYLRPASLQNSKVDFEKGLVVKLLSRYEVRVVEKTNGLEVWRVLGPQPSQR